MFASRSEIELRAEFPASKPEYPSLVGLSDKAEISQGFWDKFCWHWISGLFSVT